MIHLPPAATARLLFAALALGAVSIAQDDEDPTKGEVRLPAQGGWDAHLVFDNTPEVGVWTVRSFPVFPVYATPEIVGLDDLGRCHVLVSYSGKWTPNTIIHDRGWLGGLAHADVDPRVDGLELYTGGQRGHLYQVVSYREGVLDCRRIAVLPGREIHTIVAGEFDPRTAGAEVLVFTRPGELYRVTPTGPDGRFETTLLGELPGRIRDAIPLPASAGDRSWIATISRTGRLALLRIGADGAEWRTVHEEAMGMGRLALGATAADGGIVLYSGQDDGRILRHEGTPDGSWNSETIYLGPQGNRGVAAGRFVADPDVESVAVFGYSAQVQLLHRKGDAPWQVETVFVDDDRGHALAVCEVDGRNGTDEIVASGYGGRVVLLSRPPGYGVSGAPVAPAPIEPRPPESK